MRLNLTLQRGIRKADAYFISVPKSGRTWFRTMWAAYWCHRAGVDFNLKPKGIPGMPWMKFAHDRWENLVDPNPLLRVLGHSLIPASAANARPKILLIRDPRDVVVSLYFQLTKRPRPGQRWIPATLSDLVRHPEIGIGGICSTMSGWYDEWQGAPNFRMYRYEDARKEPASALRDLLHFVGAAADDACVSHAIAYADFGSMQRREREGQFQQTALTPRDRGDLDSFKARRGAIGGFVDYLDAKDLDYCNERVARLPASFGYGPSPEVRDLYLPEQRSAAGGRA